MAVIANQDLRELLGVKNIFAILASVILSTASAVGFYAGIKQDIREVQIKQDYLVQSMDELKTALKDQLAEYQAHQEAVDAIEKQVAVIDKTLQIHLNVIP